MVDNVVITEAKPKKYLIDEKEKPVLVCAYCRVSTDKNDQRNSYEAQKKFFDSEFKRHKNWIGCQIFSDKGISGTSIKRRDGFNQMIKAAKNKEYQLIIIKDVSRFSRNIQDALNIVDDLRKNDVYIWFMADDINTEDIGSHERLSAVENAAQAESYTTSKKVRWGQRQKMEEGVVFGRRDMFGYNIVRDESGEQHFEIIEEEAEIVRKIFSMYAQGYGTFRIARSLENAGIATKRFKNGWSNTIILRILRNEKYVGALKTGKTYTTDVMSHKKKYNRGESASFYIAEHHPDEAIIDKELWNKVQLLLEKNTLSDAIKGKHSNRYWCSGKVFCGECGERYISHIKHLKCGKTYKSWKCWTAQQYGHKKSVTLDNGEDKERGCTSESVNDVVLRQAVHDVVEAFLSREADFDTMLKLPVETAKHNKFNANEKRLKKLQENLTALNATIRNLTIKFANGDISKEAYDMTVDQQKEELSTVQQEIYQLTEESKQSLYDTAKRDNTIALIKSLAFLDDAAVQEELYNRIVDKIIVHTGHILEVYFVGIEHPVMLFYTAKGRMENYSVTFTIK